MFTDTRQKAEMLDYIQKTTNCYESPDVPNLMRGGRAQIADMNYQET
jgi:hypothetical protein